MPKKKASALDKLVKRVFGGPRLAEKITDNFKTMKKKSVKKKTKSKAKKK